MELAEEVEEGAFGLLDGTDPLLASLRSEPGGQDGLSFAGGEQLPRRASSPETASGLKFRRCSPRIGARLA